MAKRITIYVDNETAYKLAEYDNKSKIIKEALNSYFLNKEYFIGQQKMVEKSIKEIRFQLNNKNEELQFIKNRIKKIEQQEKERPKNYIKAVNTLKCLPDTNMEDLCFQAQRLNISVDHLKGWLLLDGYYDEIFPEK